MNQDDAIQSMMDSSDKALRQSTDDYVDDLQSKWDDFQARLEADILKIHSQLPEDATYADFVQFQGDAKVSKVIAEQLKRLHIDIDSSRMDALIQQYKDAYNMSAWTLDEATPPSVEIDHNLATDDQIKMFVSADWDNSMFVTRNAKEFYFLAQDVKKEVTLAMLQGSSVKELTDSIADVIGDEDSDYRYRSERIARTELIRAATIGRQHLYDTNDDLMEDQVWITRGMGSPRLCENCAERSGMTYDDVVDIADEQELDVDPPCHPNCCCQWAPKLKSMSELLGPELSKGVKDFDEEEFKFNPQTYQKWATANL